MKRNKNNELIKNTLFSVKDLKNASVSAISSNQQTIRYCKCITKKTV